ncbi:YwqG family protein [Craurococcus roseus]|uniref:YwqG family protein n=1 Tax=Craurococcus roseus TaxID=77585 RepID=A0ABN1FVG3_9PROT
MPPGFDWPRHNGRPLDHLLQIDLGELGGVRTNLGLPAHGRLLFFYDVERQPWGIFPHDAGSAQVVHLEDAAGLTPLPPSQGRPALPSARALFEPVVTVPDDLSGSPWLEGVHLTEEERAEASEARKRDELAGYSGQIGGHPHCIQSAMEVGCELASSGFGAGSSEDFASTAGVNAKREARAWRLLLQLPSRSALGAEWGSGLGVIYFWIKRDALARRDFSRVWLMLQTT